MAYRISFKGDTVTAAGSIFQMDDMIFFTGGSGITVKVKSQIYHQRMRNWIDGFMVAPLVFVDADGSRLHAHGQTWRR